MSKLDLLPPLNSQLIFVDHQPQMAFGVQSIDRCAGQQLLDLFNHALGTRSQLADMRPFAIRTGGWHPGLAVTPVAQQVRLGGMVGQRHGTTAAGDHVAAVPALHDGRGAAAVQEKDRLMTARDAVLQSLCQCPAEDTPVAISQLLAHIADLDLS